MALAAKPRLEGGFHDIGLIQLDNHSGRGYQDNTQGEMGGAVRLEAPVQPWPESFYQIQVTMEVKQDV
jgi:hypothetical protein